LCNIIFPNLRPAYDSNPITEEPALYHCKDIHTNILTRTSASIAAQGWNYTVQYFLSAVVDLMDCMELVHTLPTLVRVEVLESVASDKTLQVFTFAEASLVWKHSEPCIWYDVCYNMQVYSLAEDFVTNFLRGRGVNLERYTTSHQKDDPTLRHQFADAYTSRGY